MNKLRPFFDVLLALILIAGISGCSLLYPTLPPTPTVTTQATGASREDVTATPAVTVPGDTVTPAPSPVQVVSEPSLVRIRMFTRDQGWGLTETQVLRTEDGVVTWLDFTPEEVNQVGFAASGYFADPETAWILIADPEDFQQGTLYHTQNGGLDWIASSTPFSHAELFFLDEQKGWALYIVGAGAGSSVAQIFRTQDGGENWSLVYEVNPETSDMVSGIPFSGSKEGLSFRDENHGFVAGNIPADGFAYLYHTRDGGESWEQAPFEIPPAYRQNMLVFTAPRFFTPQAGKMAVRFFGAQGEGTLIFTTIDGGESWLSTTPVPGYGLVDIVDLQTIFIWDGGTLYLTRDGGAVWLSETPDINLVDTLAQIEFVDQLTGFALAMDASGNTRLYTTHNAGLTWSRLP